MCVKQTFRNSEKHHTECEQVFLGVLFSKA